MPLQPHDTERQNSDALNGVLSWTIGLAAAVTQCQTRIETATAVPQGQFTALERCSEHAPRWSGAGDELPHVERHLSENLQTVKTLETRQDTVLNVNAAANLLVARGANNRAA